MPVDSVKTQDSTNQTEAGTEAPDSEVMSSPEQVDVKSLKKGHRWKP